MSRIRLGYTFINPYLKNNLNIHINRGIKFNSIKKNGFDRMKDLAKQNISDLYTLLDWNISKNIKVFCLPNNIIPHVDNYELYNIDEKEAYNYGSLDFIKKDLKQIGKMVEYNDITLVFSLPNTHSMTSNNKQISNTFYSIDKFSYILDFICPSNGNIIIKNSLPNKYKKNDKISWIDAYKYVLHENSKRYLALQNDCNYFSTKDCLDIHYSCGVPIALDMFHHSCYGLNHKIDKFDWDKYVLSVADTWYYKRPLFCYSEQGKGNIGKHNNFIDHIPLEALELSDRHFYDFDLLLKAPRSLESLLQIRKMYKIEN